MKHIKTYQEISEKKEPKNVVMTSPKISHELNKHYDIDSKPASSRSDDKWYAHTYKHEIAIADEDPVIKFREWEKNLAFMRPTNEI